MQQVAPGKDCADLCEQPLPMEAFGVGQNLNGRTGEQRVEREGEKGHLKRKEQRRTQQMRQKGREAERRPG